MITKLRVATVLALAAAAPACSDSTGSGGGASERLYYLQCCSAEVGYQGALYAVAPDGGTPSVIADNSSIPGVTFDFYNSRPWVSLDGEQITLAGDVQGQYSLVTIDTTGRLISAVAYPTSFPYYQGQPDFSAAAGRVAWFADGYLNLANPDGSALERIYFDSLARFGDRVAWSADGRSLAYSKGLPSRDNPWGPVNFQLWTLRLSDGFTRPVTQSASAKAAPAWSRDGRWLTFASEGDIHRSRTDGSDREQILYSGNGAQASAWGPGDSLVVIAAGGALLVLRPDGSGARTLVSGYYINSAAWGK